MRYGRYLTGMMLILLIFSCATAPRRESSPPDWYINPPSNTDSLMYFTVSAQAMTIKELEENAAQNLFSQIMSGLGISTDISRGDDLSGMRDEILSVVKGKEIDGLKLIEKQIVDEGEEKVIYLLAEMKNDKKKELEDRIEQILRSGSSATIYSDKAQADMDKGSIYQGILNYLKAAAEAAGSDNRFLVEKNLTAAKDELKKISIRVLNVPSSMSVGQNAIFSVKLFSSSAEDKADWSNVSIKVSFRDRKKGGIIGDRFAILRTDSDGSVTFIHPSPGFTGTGRVKFSLDLADDSASLDVIAKKYSDLYSEFNSVLDGVSTQFQFAIVSSAPSVPTGIFVIDSDFLRKPLDSSDTAQGIESGLTAAGFDVQIVKLEKDPFFNLSGKELLRDLPYMVGSDLKRIVFGIARISEFDDAKVGYTVVTEAEIKVLDLETGEILFDETLSKKVQGGDSKATISTSFKELGKSFSSLLVDKLP